MISPLAFPRVDTGSNVGAVIGKDPENTPESPWPATAAGAARCPALGCPPWFRAVAPLCCAKAYVRPDGTMFDKRHNGRTGSQQVLPLFFETLFQMSFPSVPIRVRQLSG